jgi:hypothetical protein
MVRNSRIKQMSYSGLSGVLSFVARVPRVKVHAGSWPI